MAFTNDQELLTLSMLAYRGFGDPLGASAARLRKLVHAGLQTLAALAGKWELAWGPVSARQDTILLDDTMVYVVQAVDDPSRLVVVIRGTNPLAAFDWLCGDFRVARQVAWHPPGLAIPEQAAIALCTAHGLASLLGLRARGDALVLEEDPGERRAAADLTTMATLPGLPALGLLPHLDPPLAFDLHHRTEVLMAHLHQVIHAGAQGERDVHAVPLVLTLVRDHWERSLEQIDPALARGAAPPGAAPDLLPELIDASTHPTPSGRGQTLVEFLRDRTATAPGLTLTVTGHSKGGALASTLALYLADSQGKQPPAAHRWDPDRRAEVRCTSFAGPTAGNAGFAAHSDAVLHGRCRRIVNTGDLVPQAWNADTLRRSPTLYEPELSAPRVLAAVFDFVAEQVAPLRYTQVALADPRPLKLLPGLPGRLYPVQLLHQHGQAYLDLLGLDNELLRDFFLPGRAAPDGSLPPPDPELASAP